MSEQTRISAMISDETKRDFERFVEDRGLKRAFVLEQALQFHMRALRDVPPEFLIPPKVTLAPASFERVVDRVKNPRKPTPAMRELQRRRRR